jgi:hypothetical protein
MDADFNSPDHPDPKLFSVRGVQVRAGREMDA